MQQLRRMLLCGLWLAVGCSSAAIEPASRDPAFKAVNGNAQSSKGVVVARQGQAGCQAKRGQVVHFAFGYTVVPELMISRLKVTVNRKPIPEPEVFSPETKPGYGELVYVFRAQQCGEYQVEVTPVYLGGEGSPVAWVVEVTE